MFFFPIQLPKSAGKSKAAGLVLLDESEGSSKVEETREGSQGSRRQRISKRLYKVAPVQQY